MIRIADRNRIWLLFLLFCCPLVLSAQGLQRLPGAEELITRAADFGTRQQYDTAISLLTVALDRYPTYAPLYLALADWQELRGLVKIAGKETGATRLSSIPHAQLLLDPINARSIFETYGKAMTALPENREVHRRVQMLLANDYPQLLGSNGIFALPGEPQVFSFSYFDQQLPAPGEVEHRGLFTTVPLSPGEAFRRDPKYGRGEFRNDPGWNFSNILYAYTYDAVTESWTLRFRVMWQFAPTKEIQRAQTARDVAGILLRLYDEVKSFSGLTPRFSDNGAVNIWLTEQHLPGAETLRENIYFFNMDAERSAPEWVRQIAHEYGHLTLPPIAGYSAPESVASGYLGERLFMKLLLRNTSTQAGEHPWLLSIDAGAFQTRFYDLLISKFCAIGTSSEVILGNDAEAMDTVVGMALYLAEVRGSRFLSVALSDMRAPQYSGANGFLQTVQNLEMYLQGLDQPVVTVRIIPSLPAETYRVFLREGNWVGEVQGANLAKTQYDLSINGKLLTPDKYGRFKLPKVAQGWLSIKVQGVEGFPPAQITAIKLVWQDSALDANKPGLEDVTLP